MPTYAERSISRRDEKLRARVEVAMQITAMSILTDGDTSDEQLTHFAREAMKGTPACLEAVMTNLLANSAVPASALNAATSAADTALQPFVDQAVVLVKNVV